MQWNGVDILKKEYKTIQIVWWCIILIIKNSLNFSTSIHRPDSCKQCSLSPFLSLIHLIITYNTFHHFLCFVTYLMKEITTGFVMHFYCYHRSISNATAYHANNWCRLKRENRLNILTQSLVPTFMLMAFPTFLKNITNNNVMLIYSHKNYEYLFIIKHSYRIKYKSRNKMNLNNFLKMPTNKILINLVKIIQWITFLTGSNLVKLLQHYLVHDTIHPILL